MTTTKVLGRVQPKLQGDWVARPAGNPYKMLDIVQYQGDSWQLSAVSATAVAPAAPTWINLTNMGSVKSYLQQQFEKFEDEAVSSIKSMHLYDVDLQGGEFDVDLYYPVMFALQSREIFQIEVFKMYAINNGFAVEGNANPNGLMGLAFKVDAGGGTWSGNPMFTNILVNHQTYQQSVAAVGLMYNGYRLGLFLKGGHKYSVKTNRFNSPPKIFSEKALNYTNKPDGSALIINCGPVDLDTAQASDGAIPMHHASPQSMPNIYIQTLGG